VQAEHVYHEQQQGEGGETVSRPLVQELACSARQERLGPGHKIRVEHFSFEHAAERGGVDIVEAPFYV